MKKINIAFASLLIISSVSLFSGISVAHATLSVLAQVSISNATVSTHAGGIYSASFNLYNGGDTQAGVRYGVELVPIIGGAPDYSIVSDQKIASDAISIANAQSIPVTVDYSIPQTISGDYEMLAVVSNKSGLTLATAHLKNISISATNAITLDSSSCYLTVSSDISNKHYTLSEGVDVSTTDDLILNCKAVSSFTVAKTVVPSVSTSIRSAFGDAVSSPVSDQSISFAPRESKNISISIPKPVLPQAYNSSVILNAPSGAVSNSVRVHWVLQGDSATIQDVSMDKSGYVAGDTALVSFIWTGRADSFSGSRIGTSTTQVSGVVAHVTLCGKSVDQSLISNGQKVNIQIPISTDCLNPNVAVTIGNAVKNFDSVSSEVQSYIPPQLTESITTTAGGSGNNDAYVILGLCLLAIVIITLSIKFIGKSGVNSIVITLIISGSTLAFIGSVSLVGHAQTGNYLTQSVALTSGGGSFKYDVSQDSKYANSLANYIKYAEQANRTSSSVVFANNRTIDVNTFLATNSIIRTGNTRYSCSFNRYPTFMGDIASYYEAGARIPIAVSNKHLLDNTNCTRTSHIVGDTANPPIPVLLSEDLVTVALTKDNGSSTVVYSSNLANALDTYTVPSDFSGTIKVHLSYKIITTSGATLVSINNEMTTSVIGWDITLIRGGTISWRNPVDNNTESATISINKSLFKPGEDVTFSATDPMILYCSNGHRSSPTIDLYVLPVNQQGSSKTRIATINSAVTNQSILNSPSHPLAVGNYYLFATYTERFYFHTPYDREVYYNLGTVRIPFTVDAGISAPVINSSTSICPIASTTPQVLVTWSSSKPGSSYKVNRSSDGGFSYGLVSGTLSTTTSSYIDTKNLLPLKDYLYTVSTFDLFGNALTSTPLPVTTLSCSATSTATTTAVTNAATSSPATASSTSSIPGDAQVQIGSCAPISHATLCPGSYTGSSVPANTLNTVETGESSCQTPPAVCEFYCNSPYHPQNHQCVQSSTIEI